MNELEKWAQETAPTHDWDAHDRVFYGGADDADIEAMEKAGLVCIDYGEVACAGGLCWGADMDRCDALEAYLVEIVASLVQFEIRVLRNDPPMHWGAAVGAAIEALTGRGLMRQYSNTSMGRAVLRHLEAI